MKNTIEKKLMEDTKKIAEEAEVRTKNNIELYKNAIQTNAIPKIIDDYLIEANTYE